MATTMMPVKEEMKATIMPDHEGLLYGFLVSFTPSNLWKYRRRCWVGVSGGGLSFCSFEVGEFSGGSLESCDVSTILMDTFSLFGSVASFFSKDSVVVLELLINQGRSFRYHVE